MRRLPRCAVLLITCLVLLQVADFLFTWMLIGRGQRLDVYESNPLANAILARFGWSGLGAFKLLCSLVALGAVALVVRRRPQVAARVLVLLCLVMLGVVGYSGVLLARPAQTEHDLPSLQAQAFALDGQFGHIQRFSDRRATICDDLLRGRADLRTTVARMRECIEQLEPEKASCDRTLLPDLKRSSQVATYVYFYVTRQAKTTPVGRVRLRAISREMAVCFPGAPRIDGRQYGNGSRLRWAMSPPRSLPVKAPRMS